MVAAVAQKPSEAFDAGLWRVVRVSGQSIGVRGAASKPKPDEKPALWVPRKALHPSCTLAVPGTMSGRLLVHPWFADVVGWSNQPRRFPGQGGATAARPASRARETREPRPVLHDPVSVALRAQQALALATGVRSAVPEGGVCGSCRRQVFGHFLWPEARVRAELMSGCPWCAASFVH